MFEPLPIDASEDGVATSIYGDDLPEADTGPEADIAPCPSELVGTDLPDEVMFSRPMRLKLGEPPEVALPVTLHVSRYQQ